MKPSLQPSPAMLRGANGLWRERRRGRSQMMLSCCSGNLRIVGASAWLAEWQTPWHTYESQKMSQFTLHPYRVSPEMKLEALEEHPHCMSRPAALYVIDHLQQS
ncbi:hypothetical protein ACRRTK_007374 [Alexandromys fortis]